MRLMRNNRTTKQIQGNICLVLFLAFLFTTIFSPVGAEMAYADVLQPPLRVEESQVSVTDNQVKIYMLLKPTTDQKFDSILVDFSEVIGVQKVVYATYQNVKDDIYGYVAELVYDLPPGATLVNSQTPVLIKDSDGNLILTEYVYKQVKPPTNPETVFTINAQSNKFPVGSTALLNVHMESQQDVIGADFELSFDPNRLRVEAFIPAANMPSTHIEKLDQVNGKVTFAVATTDGKLPRSGDFGQVKFTVLWPGDSQVSFTQGTALTPAPNYPNGKPLTVKFGNDFTVTGVKMSAAKGKVDLVDWNNGPGGVNISVLGGNSNTTTLGDGTYNLELLAGSYDLVAAFQKHLKVKRHVDVAEDQTLTGINFTLISGDANGDNRISLLDLMVLAREYSNTDSGHLSDFNGDGGVSLVDLSILAKNYNAVGDN